MAPSNNNTFGHHQLFIDQQFNPDEEIEVNKNNNILSSSINQSGSNTPITSSGYDLPSLGGETAYANNNSIWGQAFTQRNNAAGSLSFEVPSSASVSASASAVNLQTAGDFESHEGSFTQSETSPELQQPQPTAQPVELPSLPSLPSLPKLNKPSVSPSAAKSSSSLYSKTSSKVQERFSFPVESQVALSKADFSKIIISVKEKHSVSIDSSMTQRDGRIFIVSGSPKNVAAARLEIAKRLTKPVTLKFPVSSKSKAVIIGSGGKTIKEIIKKYEVHIDISHDDIEGSYDPEFDESLTEVTITGAIDAANGAKKDIMTIVNEHGKNVTIRVPIENPDLFLLSGLKGNLLQALSINKEDPLTQAKSIGNEIVVLSGSRDAVKRGRSELNYLLDNVSKNITTANVDIKKVFQSLIASSAELNDEFHVTYEFVGDIMKITGSQANVSKATEYVKDFVNNSVVEPITISRAHNNNLEHARDILYFFTKEYEAISSKLAAVDPSVSLDLMPLDKVKDVNFVAVKLVGKKTNSDHDVQESIKAVKKALISEVNELKPSKFLIVGDIDLNIFKNDVIALLSTNPDVKFVIKRDLLPEEDSDSDAIILVYAASDDEDDFTPTDEEYGAKLRDVCDSLNSIRERQSAIASSYIEFDADLQSLIFGPESKTLQLINNHVHSKGQIQYKLNSPSEGELTLRGDEECIKEVEKIIATELSTEEQLNKNAKITFQIPSKVVPRIIGSKGHNLNQIRERFNVQIDIANSSNNDPETEVEVQGFAYNVNQAKIHIRSEAKKLADITTLKVEVPFKVRGSVIGAKGLNINKLIEKYNVTIDFDDQDINCSIRGNTKNVEKCVSELTKFVDFIKETSFTVVKNVPAQHIPRIIGKQGKNIEFLRKSFGVEFQIGDIPAESEAEDATVAIEITGISKDVNEAAKKLDSIVKELEDYEVKTLEIDPKFYKYIIGSNGSTLKQIYSKVGITTDDANNTGIKYVDLPNANDEEKVVTLKGSKKIVAKLEAEINKIVADISNRVTEQVPEVPEESYGTLIGVGGTTLKRLEEQFQVEINVPNKNSKADSKVEITGLPENIAKCVTEIKTKILADLNNSVEIKIPAEYHAFVSQHGSFINKLSMQSQVIVRHGNKNGTAMDLVRNNFKGLELPELASDSPVLVVSQKEYFPEMQAKVAPNTQIPWRLIYEPVDLSSLGEEFKDDESKEKKSKEEILADVKKEIEDRLELIKENEPFFGFIDLKSPKAVAKVLGPNGSNINKIRFQTGCIIDVPKRNSEKKILTVFGPKSNVEKALELIKK
ncbi:hypothetical protein ACO0SA_003145 [Hanseniaspora valbyensis]